MSAAVRPIAAQSSAQIDDQAVGLPAWIYRDPGFLELEKRSIFRTSWQLACHGNDLPNPGDYHVSTCSAHRSSRSAAGMARSAACTMSAAILVPQGRVTLRPRTVNSKNIADNYSDGMHIDVAHPGPTRLFGRS